MTPKEKHTCRWCQTTNKSLELDSTGVCRSCRQAARYPDRRYEDSFSFDRVDGGTAMGKRTRPVWGYDRDLREEEE